MPRTLTNDQLLMREYIKLNATTQQYADESAYFEFFAAAQKLREYDLNDEEIESGLTGGGGDGGCDGVYLFLNNLLIRDDFFESWGKGISS